MKSREGIASLKIGEIMKTLSLTFVTLLVGLACETGLMTMASPAKADVILYLDNVVFADGGTASGYFDWIGDFPKNTKITTSSFDTFGLTYEEPGLSGFDVSGGGQIGLGLSFRIGNGFGEEIVLSARGITDYTNAALITTASALDPHGSYEGIFSLDGSTPEIYRSIVSGNLTTIPPAVPEPSTWALILLGFASLGFMDYRRSKSAFA